MRLRKNEMPLNLEEHTTLSRMINTFVREFTDASDIIAKGFAQNSPAYKSLKKMNETAVHLRYTLQQLADFHKRKLDKETNFSSEENFLWSRLYLGER